MTALSHDKQDRTAVGGLYVPADGYVVKDAITVYQGSMVGRDPDDSGYLKPLAASKPMYQPVGVASAKLVGDSIKKGLARAGLYEFENSGGGDAIVSTLPLGWPLYAADDNTVALTWNGGLRAKAGVFGGWSRAGRPLVWVGMDPYGLTEIIIPLVKGHADLTAAATSESFDLWTTPGPCRVLDPGVIDSLTVFSGGAVSAATVAFGIDTGPDVDAIGNETDIFTGAAAAPKAMGAGVLGFSGAPVSAGVTITATFATTDDNVVNLSAGAIVACVRLRPGS